MKIRILGADDRGLAGELVALINAVYAEAERGLWREGWSRTTVAMVSRFIADGELAVAERDGRVVGAVRLHDVSEDTAEFGLLAATFEARGTGVGRDLIAFAEDDARRRGLRNMQLELLVPRDWEHPSKQLLRGWYGRLGYELVATAPVGDTYPFLVPELATPCDLERRVRNLQDPPGAAT